MWFGGVGEERAGEGGERGGGQLRLRLRLGLLVLREVCEE